MCLNCTRDSNSNSMQYPTSEMYTSGHMSSQLFPILQLPLHIVSPIHFNIGHCNCLIYQHDGCYESRISRLASRHLHGRRRSGSSSPTSTGGGASIPRPNHGGEATMAFVNLMLLYPTFSQVLIASLTK